LATDLVANQSGPAGVSNIFVWDGTTGTNVLASGQGGSYTVTGNSSSFTPVLSRHSLPYFSSNATDLVTGVQGTTNAFVNTIIQAQVTLGPITIPDGAAPGTVVGTFTIQVLQGPPGQFRLPTITLGPGGADDGAFTITPVTTSTPGALVLEVTANQAVQGTYSIVVTVDLGLGDPLINPFTLKVTGGSNLPPPPPPGAVSASITLNPGGGALEVVSPDGTLTQYDTAGPHNLTQLLGLGPVRSASAAFNPFAQEVLVAVLQDGTLVQFDSAGEHFLLPGVQSASATFNPLGQEVFGAVLQDGTLAQLDSAGEHFLLPGARSASAVFNPYGEVFTVVMQDGSLIQLDSAGEHLLLAGDALAAEAVFNPFGQEVLVVILQDHSLYEIDPTGAHFLFSF
jgi:hypothetical protein